MGAAPAVQGEAVTPVPGPAFPPSDAHHQPTPSAGVKSSRASPLPLLRQPPTAAADTDAGVRCGKPAGRAGAVQYSMLHITAAVLCFASRDATCGSVSNHKLAADLTLCSACVHPHRKPGGQNAAPNSGLAGGSGGAAKRKAPSANPFARKAKAVKN